MNGLSITVIIPTKNRAMDLRRVVRSLVAQTLAAKSLIIVDQSSGGESRLAVEMELDRAQRSGITAPRLKYVHDASISSLAAARNRAMNVADGDIWLFLDDDVVLAPEFVEELVAVYRATPDATGVSGIITNYPRPSVGYRLWDTTFMRGPFHDERQPIYWRADDLRKSSPIRVRRFGGGLMSFRAEVVRGLYFDENLRGVSDGEDVDFCERLGLDCKLLLAPRARLEHHHSPSGRLHDHWLRRSARGNLFLYRKNWNYGMYNRICCGWLVFGWWLVAAIASARRLSREPCRALRTGLQEARAAIADPKLAGVR